MSAQNIKRLRGAVLEVLNANHRDQKPRLELVVLWSVLRDVGHADLTKNDLVTALQDMKERSYIGFEQKKNSWTGDIRISAIQILPKGRDLLEGTIEDAAVLLN